jgi:type II secretory pathway pseudopilin PulG
MIGRVRFWQDERGITFVEMMVASAIAAVVGSLLIAALSMVTHVDRFTSQDSQALGQLRTATERFQKELRQARKVYCGCPADDTNVPASTTTTVHFWVDYDRNNQQDLEEQVIWRLETASSGGMRLIRTNEQKEADDEDPFIQAVNLLTGSSFAYSPAPPDTTAVTLTLRADVSPGSDPSARTVRTQVRLRNATA